MPNPIVTEGTELSNITAAVLAGGLGTRLRPVVADRPKVLAEIRGRPFLAYLLDRLAAAGLHSVVLCTGYRGGEVAHAFGDRYGSVRLVYSQEPQSLGTGGALRRALPHLVSDPVLVMNGDSLCVTDLKAFWEWHRYRGSGASMMLARVRRNERYGTVKIDADGRVVEFAEKKHGAGPGWINAGVYFLSQGFLRSIPNEINVSLEHDLFPRWIMDGVYGYCGLGRFLDIGTPEDFAAAENFLESSGQDTGRPVVVLDRDGTIIEEREYLADPKQVQLIPGVGAALRELKQIGFGLVVLTNQSGIGRGFFDEAQLKRIHKRLEHLLEAEGVYLDGLYFCPHKPDDDCFCRKPKLGLIQKASEELGFSPEASIVIGDKACDIDMGRMAGAMTFLVRTGYGAQVAAEENVTADFIVDDLPAATQAIRRLIKIEGKGIDGH
jgi:histidinol-phosphate phosphatase family protein